MSEVQENTSGIVSITNAPEGEPSDEFLKIWFREHQAPDGSFFLIERPVTNSDGGQDISFDWGIGPFLIKAVVNLGDLSINLEAGVTVPILGYVKLTSITGSLKTGVTFSFDAVVAKGSVTFYLKGKDVWIKYSFSALGATYSGDSKIFTLPI